MAAHEYDPDDNFDHAFHAQPDLDEADALEAVAWQFLLLVNPDDEDAAQSQLTAFRQQLEDHGAATDPAALLREAIDWKAGFCVPEGDAQALMEVVDELVSRWQLRIDWDLDEDDEDGLPDPVDLLQSAHVQLRERHFSLWTVETGAHQLAGWIIRERDEEAMQLIAGTLGMHARTGVG